MWLNKWTWQIPTNKHVVCIHRSKMAGFFRFPLMPPESLRFLLSHLIGIRCLLKKEKCHIPSYLVAQLFEAETKLWLKTPEGHVMKLKHPGPHRSPAPICLQNPSCQKWHLKWKHECTFLWKVLSYLVSQWINTAMQKLANLNYCFYYNYTGAQINKHK